MSLELSYIILFFFLLNIIVLLSLGFAELVDVPLAQVYCSHVYVDLESDFFVPTFPLTIHQASRLMPCYLGICLLL